MKIAMNDERLRYCGRIDWSNPEEPVFIYPCTSLRMRFTGEKLKVHIRNRREYWENDLGCILDGKQLAFRLPHEGEIWLTIPVEPVSGTEHEVLLFKRQDACHEFALLGLELAEDGDLLELPPRSERRIEVYGDSVSAGEVSEAVDDVGRTDPPHNGQYSNSWYSYAWMTARKLGAEIHDIAQGGMALLDGTGWFHEPHGVGMETAWDKIRYNEALGEILPWDFSCYTPQVVIVALGQNDSHPEDYMKTESQGEKGKHWRRHYRNFLLKLRKQYPEAQIICCTTLLEHDASWDASIAQVVDQLEDEKIHQYVYRRNGRGTPGHLRIPEAQEMAEELASYIECLPVKGWQRGTNRERLHACMQRAKKGEELTIAFLGGSITQGSLATKPENTYAYRVFSWWERTFPKALFHYINGGIGGTTSHYGVSRAVTDVLMYQPDFVVVDFSVNDEPDSFFQETYEGVLRKVLFWKSAPAVLILNNVYYDIGVNAQIWHNAVGDWYGVDHVSIRDSLYQEMKKGVYTREELTPDGLHPNDRGHGLVAGEIIAFLERIKEEAEKIQKQETQEAGAACPGGARQLEEAFWHPMTANAYEEARRLTIREICPDLQGFCADTREKSGHLDHFKNGWIGKKAGDRICFEVTASCIAIQYRKTIAHPALRARMILDGQVETARILDGNFEENWGDCLYLEPVLHHGEEKTHRLELEILPEDEKEMENREWTPFYLMALIIA